MQTLAKSSGANVGLCGTRESRLGLKLGRESAYQGTEESAQRN